MADLFKRLTVFLSAGYLAATMFLAPPTAADEVDALVDARLDSGAALADAIWGFAELGYLEERSSRTLQDALGARGFRVESGVADIPTAFVATYGRGKPVIGILAEFDALPGLSQAAVPYRSPLEPHAPGHACGHHLFGAASVTAALALADWLDETGSTATVRVYGTPAEEGGSGKVYLTRAGLFDDVDVVLHWHPSDGNSAAAASSTANKSGRFTFHGIAAHAASAPERGRSALDGVEAMNYMVNMMREHMPSDARIHYVITDGGDAPNIVPETAQVYYYVRHPDVDQVLALFERVVRAAEAGALGTGTEMTYEVMHGNYPLLPNETLARLVDGNLRELGGFLYDDKERAFAREIRTTLTGELPAIDSTAEIRPFGITQGMGSTDVGDVSWNVPTVGFGTATWVPGTPAHSWQAVAAGGTSIGHRGMALAARLLARTAEDLIENPTIIDKARAELVEKRGEDFEYEALLGDRAPPLDYRL
ncbi:MAG: amidohydrolase [Pseudomonadales bacterium]|jgi:aminobenzoyl-glutamate utilization protein B